MSKRNSEAKFFKYTVSEVAANALDSLVEHLDKMRTINKGSLSKEALARQQIIDKFQIALELAKYELVYKKVYIPDVNIKELAMEIETNLFIQNKDRIDKNYTSKCRSLTYNLMDVKNEELRQEVLFKHILPQELCTKSP